MSPSVILFPSVQNCGAPLRSAPDSILVTGVTAASEYSVELFHPRLEGLTLGGKGGASGSSVWGGICGVLTTITGGSTALSSGVPGLLGGFIRDLDRVRIDLGFHFSLLDRCATTIKATAPITATTKTPTPIIPVMAVGESPLSMAEVPVERPCCVTGTGPTT